MGVHRASLSAIYHCIVYREPAGGNLIHFLHQFISTIHPSNPSWQSIHLSHLPDYWPSAEPQDTSEPAPRPLSSQVSRWAPRTDTPATGSSGTRTMGRSSCWEVVLRCLVQRFRAL